MTCWNGKGAAKVRECSVPRGRAGLEYVFESMARQECAKVQDDPAEGRTLLFTCEAELDDGTDVEIDYSIWTSAGAAADHYRGILPSTGKSAGVRSWSGQVGERYVGAGAYVDEPFSLAVSVPTADALGEAITTAVTARPAARLRGEPTD